MAGSRPVQASSRAAALALLLLAALAAAPSSQGAGGPCAPGAPAAVGNLRANDPALLPVELDWNPDPRGCATATVVERADDGGAFRVVAQLPGDARGWDDLSAKPCTGYAYRVTAVNGSGAGEPAQVDASRRTGTAPAAPTALGTYPIHAPYYLILNWGAPATAADCPVRAYEVSRTQGGATVLLGRTWSPQQRYWYDTTFQPCAPATYAVTAVNAVGASEPATLQLTTPVRGPNAPQGLAAADAAVGTVRLSWSAPASNGCPLDGYRVHRDGRLVATLPPTAAQWEDASLLPCQKATYHVSGFNTWAGVAATVAHVHEPLGLPAPCPVTYTRP